jgi:hypothetical protein
VVEKVFTARRTWAGLEDIAKAAGSGPSTLYRRFALRRR